MYHILTVYHNAFRWLVLASLLLALYRAAKGYFTNAPFTKTDNAIRHWTATIAHIQLMIGMTLYFKSPIIKYFLANFKTAVKSFDLSFFALVHSTLMLTAIVLITIGSALAKREETDHLKFKTMLRWFTAAFLVIFIAIPWPFSPLASRPYFR